MARYNKPMPMQPPSDVAIPIKPITQLDQIIDKTRLAKATSTLQDYKAAKQVLEQRIVSDEEWWRLNHWEAIRNKTKPEDTTLQRPEPTSAWLFNTLINKHADAMDNYPEPNVLPREQSDEASANVLSSILPVVLEQNDFEDVYGTAWWYKLKHGTACYGTFWDVAKENGLGDIAVRMVDMLKIFWEPGITDIQQSRNLFIVDVVSDEVLKEQYPGVNIKGGNVVAVEKYMTVEDKSAKDNTSVVVDWYYKQKIDGKTVLQLCKYVGSEILFASEGNPEYPNGWYGHGLYPVVFDVLFPEEGTPYGFGFISVTRSPQAYIDKLSQVFLENAMMASKPRFWASESMGVNEAEFLDWTKPIVHVQGAVSEERLLQIKVDPVPGAAFNIYQQKIEELKETSANRDFSQGGAGGGVTAAAAIAALQEAGNKTSRDMIATSYRAYAKVCYLCIEVMRQFYDETRSFRVIGEAGMSKFMEFSNKAIQEQQMPAAAPGMPPMFRKPVFDLRVKPQKRNPYSRMAQNELAKELYGMGFFDPTRAEMTLGALELMEFEGKDKVMARVQQGQTLLMQMQQMQAEMQKMAMIIDKLTGGKLSGGQEQAQQGGKPAPTAKTGGGGASLGAKAVDAQTANMTSYGDKLAKNAVPSPDQAGKVGM